MPLLDRVHHQIGSAVRRKGEEYYGLGYVRVITADDKQVVAEVQGTDLYEVDIVRRGETLHASCDCPYMQDRGETCKHAWATLLAASRSGALGAREVAPPTRIQAHSLLFPEPRGPMAPRVPLAAPAPPSPAPPSPAPRALRSAAPRSPAAALPPKPAPEPWRSALDLVRPASVTPGPAAAERSMLEPWPPGRQVFYVLDVDASVSVGGLVLDLACRDAGQSADGRPGKIKALRVMHETIETIPDRDDRELLRMLAGPVRVDLRQPRRIEYRPPLGGPIQVPPGLYPGIFERAARTTRLRLRPQGAEMLPEPLGWDSGEPWQVRIDVESSPSGGYRLAGSLVRGEERRALQDFVMFAATGAVVSRTAVARLVVDASFEWLRAILRFGEVEFPASAAAELVDALAARPPGTLGNLPEELHLETLTVAPRARLVVRQPARPVYWAPARLEAQLSFLYDGVEAPADSSAQSVRAPGEQKLYRRDPDREAAALARLLELGARATDARKPGALELAPVQLPVIAATLTAEGWQVEADGKLYRTAGGFKLSVATGIDWFELGGEADFEGVAVEMPRLLAAIKRGERTITLGDGTLGVLPESWLEKYGMLADLGESRGERVRYRRGQVGLLDALVASLGEVSCDETFERMRHELKSFDGIDAPTPGPEFKGELREYQRQGLGWLRFLERFGFGGCLADDMGLGKTVQVLAHLATRKRGRPVLVVAPRSLVFHWRDEARRFAPALTVLDHATPDRQTDPAFIIRHDLVLTTYGTLRRDILLLKEIDFDFVILDEAQVVKNAATETFKSVRLLKAQNRLALSGTPVENHLGELWSLFEFLNPGMLGAAAVFKRATQQLGNPDDDMRGLLRRALKPFLLRRTKEAVARDLPERLEETIWCELAHGQRRLYDELRNHYRASLLGKVAPGGLKDVRFQVLEALLRLRQAACHPGLVNPALSGSPSAKLDELLPQLEEVIDGGHKALVFSQFTSFLALLRGRLDPRGVVYEYLDGKTRDRAARVKRFQEDPNCSLFLISLKAGGLGLNLTAAEYVFLLDPWWNPAAEAQAIDRAHRIGQTRNVFAYRLIATDTIEERVLELQKTKRALADAILGADKSLIASLTREDLELLLR